MDLNPSLQTTKYCAACQHAIEFGCIHYCNQLGKTFAFEALFWEIICKHFCRVGWPLPINQSWRSLKQPKLRSKFVTDQMQQFTQQLKKGLR